MISSSTKGIDLCSPRALEHATPYEYSFGKGDIALLFPGVLLNHEGWALCGQGTSGVTRLHTVARSSREKVINYCTLGKGDIAYLRFQRLNVVGVDS